MSDRVWMRGARDALLVELNGQVVATGRTEWVDTRDGRVTTRIVSLPYYESAARFGDRYRPTALQREALEAVQEIANRPELVLSMDFQEGDIQLLNNHIMLHARTAYVDYDEPERKRHLLRMWIAVVDARRRPLAVGCHPSRAGIGARDTPAPCRGVRLVTDSVRRVCEAIRRAHPHEKVRLALMNTAGNRPAASFTASTAAWSRSPVRWRRGRASCCSTSPRPG